MQYPKNIRYPNLIRRNNAQYRIPFDFSYHTPSNKISKIYLWFYQSINNKGDACPYKNLLIVFYPLSH